MDDKRLIEVDDLRVHFPLEDETVKAVDGVSWHIDKGETLAVVGESGSGKSVTAMSLMRLTDYAGGKIMSGTVNFRRKNENVIDLASSPQGIMRDIRGNDISMIFSGANDIIKSSFYCWDANSRGNRTPPGKD